MFPTWAIFLYIHTSLGMAIILHGNLAIHDALCSSRQCPTSSKLERKIVATSMSSQVISNLKHSKCRPKSTFSWLWSSSKGGWLHVGHPWGIKGTIWHLLFSKKIVISSQEYSNIPRKTHKQAKSSIKAQYEQELDQVEDVIHLLLTVRGLQGEKRGMFNKLKELFGLPSTPKNISSNFKPIFKDTLDFRPNGPLHQEKRACLVGCYL